MSEPTVMKINGNSYIIEDWDVEKSLETLVWITKTFGESILNLFMSGEALKVLDALDGEELPPETQEKAEALVSKLFMNLEPAEYVKRVKTITKGTFCNAKEIDFNQHFRGKIGELHKVLFAILRHQYSDFLGVSAGGKKE